MPGYEQKLNEFARGKKLLRLSRPLRNRADACCDACGSTQPRLLHVLKESSSGRYYFVGDTCLKELAKLGGILKAYGKESGQMAYEAEMQLRAEGSQAGRPVSEPDGNRTTPPPTESYAQDQPSPTPTRADAWPLFPAAVVIERSEYYEAFVHIPLPDGTVSGWGHARQNRYAEIWRLGGETGLSLEKVKEEISDALGLCLSRAWEEARSHLAGSELALPIPLEPGGHFGGRSPINSYRESLAVVPLVPFLSQLCERSENGEPRSSQTLETTVTKVRDH